MRSTCKRSLWIILLLISIQCVSLTKQEFLKAQQQQQQQQEQQKREHQAFVQKLQRPADIASKWSKEQLKVSLQNGILHTVEENMLPSIDDNNVKLIQQLKLKQQQQQHSNTTECAKSSLKPTTKTTIYNNNEKTITNSTFLNSLNVTTTTTTITLNNNITSFSTEPFNYFNNLPTKRQTNSSRAAVSKNIITTTTTTTTKHKTLYNDEALVASAFTNLMQHDALLHETKSIGNSYKYNSKKNSKKKKKKKVTKLNRQQEKPLHVAYTNRHKMLRDRLTAKAYKNYKHSLLHKKFKQHLKRLTKRETANKNKNDLVLNFNKKNRDTLSSKHIEEKPETNAIEIEATKSYGNIELSQQNKRAFVTLNNESNSPYTSTIDIWSMPFDWNNNMDKELNKPKEPIIIIDDIEEFDSGTMNQIPPIAAAMSHNRSEDKQLEPRASPLRPLIADPYENEEISVVYADQHTEIRLMCEVDLDIASSTWYKNGQVVHAIDRTSRATDYRFIKETNGALTITNVMLEDDGKWQCEAENTRRYSENARPVKLVVLDRPKAPYLLIDSRRLDAGNIFVPVKENSELNLACISEGGNPKPALSWEVLLSPGIDRHTQKVSAEVLELQEIKPEKDLDSHKLNAGTKTEARLPAVYRAHHNARILCVMEHPTLKVRQNASLLLDVQYTPSFAISRTPGFGYPLREGIEVSLKCDVDSNPPSTPHWQKDDGETPVTQNGDGFLNFTSIRREHSGWYKCTSRHLNFQYSSIGYYLSVRFDSVEVTSEPDDQDVSVAAASHNPNKGQLEVQLGGTVTLQCPQGSLGCWSHLDPVTARLRGLGQGLSAPSGQFSIKDVVYQDAGTYKCVGQSPTNKKKFEVLHTVGVSVKGYPTVTARDAAPVAYPGSPLHLAVEFCANPPAHAARWLHGDRVFTPGNQYGSSVLAYAVMDLPTPFCKEARLTYVSMHERVERIFYFIVSTPGGVAEAVFKVNFTKRFRKLSNSVDDEQEKLSEPEEIHFPVFGVKSTAMTLLSIEALYWQLMLILFATYICFLN